MFQSEIINTVNNCYKIKWIYLLIIETFILLYIGFGRTIEIFERTMALRSASFGTGSGVRLARKKSKLLFWWNSCIWSLFLAIALSIASSDLSLSLSLSFFSCKILILYAQLGPRINAHSPRRFSLLIKSSSFYVKIMVNVSQNWGPTLELAVGIGFLADSIGFLGSWN